MGTSTMAKVNSSDQMDWSSAKKILIVVSEIMRYISWCVCVFVENPREFVMHMCMEDIWCACMFVHMGCAKQEGRQAKVHGVGGSG